MIGEFNRIEDCSVSELVEVLICRFVMSNGFEFITPDQRDRLIEALQDKDTATK